MAARTKLKEYQAKRDFSKTREPSGEKETKKGARLAFVIQRHAASHLHYDVRLEVEGVMKSWACPKGPSFDPAVKRLAVQVEDHPVSYNDFEGPIPQGQYGGGTVMIWDYGYYTVDELGEEEDAEKKMLKDIARGKLSITFHGEHMHGSFALVRMAPRGESKPQWLMLKHRDDHADPDYDPVSSVLRSAKSDRTMEELKDNTPWQSNREPKKTKSSRFLHSSARGARANPAPVPKSELVLPMLVALSEDLPMGDDWVYEQKIDGIRVLAYVDEKSFALVTRLGNNKATQFPELGEPLQKLVKAVGKPLVLDGEISAVDAKGKALGFQDIQGRIHLDEDKEIQTEIDKTKITFFVFDILMHGEDAQFEEPWEKRHKLLKKVMTKNTSKKIQMLEHDADSAKMQKRADKEGWEGLIAKRKDSTYIPGKRVKVWLKWRTMERDDFIILGWTEPRGSRMHIGALMLGMLDDKGRLKYVGHSGSGLSQKVLDSLHKRLRAIEVEDSPLDYKVKANNTVHWVKPELVAEVQFKERTSDGILRQPPFLGLRDDKRPSDIHLPEEVKQTAPRKKPKKGEKVRVASDVKAGSAELRFTHLDKVFFPKEKITKQDLVDYYTLMQDYVLPWMLDRPLVLRRFPNGIEGKDFYQQTPDDNAPGRIAMVDSESGGARRLIGGDLVTLLYLVQIGAISYDPWHCRIQSLDYPDYSIIDLDPTEGTKFATVRKLAAACVDYLNERKIPFAMKTSGATGIHIYLPLPEKTSWETSVLASEIVCTKIAESYPKIATVERTVKKRKKGQVYMDSQQNYISKSVAGVWAVRAKPGAPVSTPISLKDLNNEVEPGDFTIHNTLKTAKTRHALWEKGMASPIDLEKLLS